MGSFDMTCAISGLPIPCGTEVRYLLLMQGPYKKPGDRAVYTTDAWTPMVPPMVSTYADYGTIGALSPAFMRRAWRAHLRKVIVPQPVGDNSCHDVSVHRGSTVRQMIDAAGEGRLFVKQTEGLDELLNPRDVSMAALKRLLGEDVPAETPTAPKGPPATVPTWRRVQRVLRGAGHGDYRAFGVDYARVMVALNGYGTPENLDDVEKAIVAAGFSVSRGRRSYAEGIMVTPLDYRGAIADRAEARNAVKRLKCDRSLAVGEAFVRADVWESMLAVRDESSWSNVPPATTETFAADADKIPAKPSEFDRIVARASRDNRLMAGLDTHPFCTSPINTFNLALEMHGKGEATDEEWSAFKQSCAELAKVKHSMMLLNRPWAPSMYAGQEHAWREMARTMGTWSAIAQKEHDDEEAERKKWETEDAAEQAT